MDLIDEAILAMSVSYAPYSKFRVGAAIKLKDGKIIRGCNIENVSYSMSICAERVAIFKAYSEGYTKDDILSMAVVSSTKNPISPCGACRQVLTELLDENTTIILSNIKKEKKELKVCELLPYAFKDLN